ncbi:MAG: class I SAM-dependent methyltransferase [Pseudomonadales bacterium]|nr:class I SAM-dependent methyltransferase [Pseudomonadales bacterium]
MEDNWLADFLPLIDPDYPLLELGCGEGKDTDWLTSRGYELICLDISSKWAREAWHLRACPSVQADLSSGLPLRTHSFSCILASLSLHYFSWATSMAVLKDLRRVLCPDGNLIVRLNSVNDSNFGAGQGEVIEPNYYLADDRYKRFFSRDDIQRLFDGWQLSALQEVETRRWNKPKMAWQFSATPV